MISINNTAYQLPYADLLRPLTETEYNELRADIEANGITYSVIIDEDNNVIDGQHRLQIAAGLGMTDIPFQILPGLSEEEKREKALNLNLHRRHLSVEDRKGMALEMRQNGQSYRAIGEKLGVSKSQIYDDINELSENGQFDLPQVITGKDGKKRPARIRTRNLKEAKQAQRLLQSMALLPIGDLTLADVKKEAKRERHQQRVEDVQAAELPDGKFHVIVIDPAWKYNRQADPTHRAANPYLEMTTEEIQDLPIPGLAFDDCILWLWATNAYMEEAHQIARGWGFEKKTILTWVKDRIGTGDWLRGQTEHCLMCIKGKPVVDLTNQSTVIHGPLREHSRKPDEFYQLVEELCPGQKIDFFARQNREGWTAYGNQLHTFQSDSGI